MINTLINAKQVWISRIAQTSVCNRYGTSYNANISDISTISHFKLYQLGKKNDACSTSCRTIPVWKVMSVSCAVIDAVAGSG